MRRYIIRDQSYFSDLTMKLLRLCLLELSKKHNSEICGTLVSVSGAEVWYHAKFLKC